MISVESVQRKFLKYLTLKVNGVYPPRGIDYQLLLDSFTMDSLEFRRILASLTSYKITNGLIDCPTILV